MSAWQQGADAARARRPFSSNPYPATSYDYVTWGNGWLQATHAVALEEEL